DGENRTSNPDAWVPGHKGLHKLRDSEPGFECGRIQKMLNNPKLGVYLNESDDIWELVYLALPVDEIRHQVFVTLEPAALAKHAFALAQRFNLFYHRYRIISEPDMDRKLFYILVVDVVRESLTKDI